MKCSISVTQQLSYLSKYIVTGDNFSAPCMYYTWWFQRLDELPADSGIFTVISH